MLELQPSGSRERFVNLGDAVPESRFEAEQEFRAGRFVASPCESGHEVCGGLQGT
jgi:hypothetical protein